MGSPYTRVSPGKIKFWNIGKETKEPTFNQDWSLRYIPINSIVPSGQAEPEGFGGVPPEPYTDTVLCVTLSSSRGHGGSVETSRTEADISRGQVLGQRSGGDNTVLVGAPGWAGHGSFTHCNCTLVSYTVLYCTPVHSSASICTI